MQPHETQSPPAQTHLAVAIVGHVDHGKSTVVGRLLADTGSLPEGKLDAVAAQCARLHQPFEHAFLVDALHDERAQGITIDAARIFFQSGQRQYQIIDAPGHVELLKNMVTGAARASAALLVVDAEEGIRENSRRHARLLSLLGVRQLAVVVNKMDRVGRAEATFAALSASIDEMLAERGLAAAHVIPVVAREGENIARRSAAMPWYTGPTVLEALDGFSPDAPGEHLPFRMPVQDVYKRCIRGSDRRVLAGTILTGRVTVGDEIVLHPGGKRARVATIERFPDRAQVAAAGEAVGLTLDDELYVRRGALAARSAEAPPRAATRIRASLFWLSRTPMVAGKRYTFALGTARVSGRLVAVHQLLDADGGAADRLADAVARNQVADCELAFDAPLACDTTDRIGETSRFVVLDEHQIRGGGLIREVVSEAAEHASNRRRHTPGAVLWLTGLSGAGKSTLASWLEAELVEQGHRVERLDGDTIRDLVPGVGFGHADRDAHIRRVGHLASRLEHHGVIVIAALISPYAASRDFVRGLCANFVEVHVSTPLAECERRDPKGLYARARRGEIAQFTGIDDPFEAPAHPELVVDTTALSVEEAGGAILDHLHQVLRASDGSPV